MFSPLSSPSRRSNICENNNIESSYNTQSKQSQPKTNRIIFSYPKNGLNIAVLQRNNSSFLKNNLTPRSISNNISRNNNSTKNLTRFNQKIFQMSKQLQLTRNKNNKHLIMTFNEENNSGIHSPRNYGVNIEDFLRFSPTRRTMIKGGLFKRLHEKKSQKYYDITEKPMNKEQKVRKDNQFECDSYINRLRNSSKEIKQKLCPLD